MARAVAVALLLLVAGRRSAAWSEPNCKDVVVGESNTLGVVGEHKPMQKVDHTEQWRQYGQITKLNLYYSWNYGCLQGIKATYGYKAGNALMVGHEKNLYTQHLKLGDYDHIVKADWRQEPSKCIEFIKLYTNKGKSLSFGNRKSTALFQTVAPPAGGWLAALKGQHDIEKQDGKQVAGGLQNLVFVWATERCEGNSSRPHAETTSAGAGADAGGNLTQEAGVAQPGALGSAEGATPVLAPDSNAPLGVSSTTSGSPDVAIGVIPAAPPAAGGSNLGSADGDTIDAGAPADTQVYMSPQAGVPVDGSSTECPAVPSMCSEEAPPGSSAFCPVASPFTRARCEGGCCFSSGRCKMPLCRLNGLGADVMALDFICYGKNNGPFGGFNKCRNLACMLAKPGCQSSLLGGNCVGTVVAANDNLDKMAKQYIGKPCIEVVNHPGPLLHMPLNKPGLPVPNGAYSGSLWSVCDCTAQPSPVLPAVPCFDLQKQLLGRMHPLFTALVAGLGGESCQGPLCALLPQLPVLNTSFPEIQIPMMLLANLTALLKPQPLLDAPPLAGLIPAIQLPDIHVRSIPLTLPDLPTFEDCAANFVKIAEALKPAIEAVLPASLSKHDLVHLVSSLLPQIRFEAPQIDIVAEVTKTALPNLVDLVKAALPKLPQFPQIAVNFPQLLRLPVKMRAQQDAAAAETSV